MFCQLKPSGSMPAGQATAACSWGDTIISDDANYNWDGNPHNGADFQQTRDIGLYASNYWGFFDMHGNVWEWTADGYVNDASGAQTIHSMLGLRARAGFIAVVRGTIRAPSCVLPTARPTPRVSATLMWVSVSPCGT